MSEADQVALATELAVFSAPLALVSRGRPLPTPAVEVFLGALEEEGAPSVVRSILEERWQQGVRPQEIAPNPWFSREQVAHLLVSLAIFALREGRREPQALPAFTEIAALYGAKRTTCELLVKTLGPRVAGTEPPDLARCLRDYLNPTDDLDPVAERVLWLLDPSRRPKRSVARVFPSAFQHPLDAEALRALGGLAGFDDLIRLVSEHGVEKSERVLHYASLVRVGPRQCGGLYRVYRACVERAGITPEPALFLQPGQINALTGGIETPYLILDSGTVSLLSQNELEFIIGHELGHIRCQHLLYHFLGAHLRDLAGMIPIVGKLIGIGAEAALEEWRRKSELSADRFGLLVCQDLDAALRVMVKWSGVPPAYYHQIDIDAFVAQNDDFEALDQDKLSFVYKILHTLERSHPWTVVRAAALREWHGSGTYTEVLGRTGDVTPDAPLIQERLAPQLLPFICPVCGREAAAAAKSCSHCHAPLREADRLRGCPTCGERCAPEFKFCESCGQALT
jgi:Zn-dependent protease with chaperone function